MSKVFQPILTARAPCRSIRICLVSNGCI